MREVSSSRTEYPPPPSTNIVIPSAQCMGSLLLTANLRVGRFVSRKARRINMTLRRRGEVSCGIRPSNKLAERAGRKATDIASSLTAKL
jgi:hypothetical protein